MEYRVFFFQHPCLCHYLAHLQFKSVMRNDFIALSRKHRMVYITVGVREGDSTLGGCGPAVSLHCTQPTGWEGGALLGSKENSKQYHIT